VTVTGLKVADPVPGIRRCLGIAALHPQ
jgi:hypothetical protein